MPAMNAIAPDKLARLLGTPSCPAIIDVRTVEDFAADPRSIPGSLRRNHKHLGDWASEFVGKRAIVVGAEGHTLSEGIAALLRHAAADAEILDGGALAWAAAGLPMVPESALPQRDALGRTVWVTRARPKVDRIACPWLVRRFVDPTAVFLFVSSAEVAGVAERFGATPFDVEVDGIMWSHDGGRCTFDAMLDGFGLAGIAPLAHLGVIVRGADTAQPDLAPEAAGLVALSLGLSRMFADDLEQLNAGMLIYDALYRWCRDATGETHDWASHRPKSTQGSKARP
jgi:rhodanese-related sulfurtransferase